MDPLSIITTALIAGAAAGGKDAASAAVRDAYATLRDRLGGGSGDSDAVAVIGANEAAPGSNIGELEAAVECHRVVGEGELRAAAETLLSLLPSDRVDHARNSIDLHHAQRIQVAFDESRQVNIDGDNTGTINLA